MRALAVGVLALISACGKKERPLTIWWFEWPPARGLQELGDEFQKETGIAVKVQGLSVTNWQERIFLEFGNRQTGFDIVVGDSQWIGRGATQGLYLELTDWLPTVVDLKTIHPRAARYLCEYPAGSNRWYAAPCETDAVGFAYRRDWFEDAKEKEAFRARHQRELKVPETWDELKDVAEFFHRPQEKRYGLSMLTGRKHDTLIMGFQNLLWAFGGSWGDRETFRVKGHLNVPGSVEAIEFMRGLLKLGAPGCEALDYGDTLQYFKNGSALMMNYFAFYPDIQKEYGEKAGFFVMPGRGGRRVISLGGQGLSISARIPAERQAMAKRFIAWFLKREVQEKWITKPAGFTANVDILRSEAFRKASPYNGPFADSLDNLEDFWNVPVYSELLTLAQRYIGQAIDGEKPPKEALDVLAEEHEKVLKNAGLLK
jgi:multiple sugar transport system substrate-binding protein